jgi:TPP-dependent pyruvate/acetoin dehydrogenase alpha subunit
MKEERADLEEAIAFALGSPDPEPIEAFDDVFAEGA